MRAADVSLFDAVRQTKSWRMLKVLAVSVFIFKRKELTESVSRTISLASAASLHQLASVWLPILMFYTPVHIFTTVVVTSFLLLPVNYAAALWVGSLTVYYLITGSGEPEHTGPHLMPALPATVLAM